jgi:hypothetical protein
MKLLARNTRTIYGCHYYSVAVQETDSSGNSYDTGQHNIQCGELKAYTLTVGARIAGTTEHTSYGIASHYDKICITADMDCDINESTWLFIDKDIEYDKAGNPLPDYEVIAISKTLNYIAYAVRRREDI